ncbi:MAG: hypothetical protein AAGC76_07045 [Luteibacter sp.]|jgi:hypothetical protein|uniref:hypothetical protein n=1 Tax=Luteibacter sp. TaxID=1886636 RepID=UPI0028086D67|nr:hypothetical protein [Luteibacter sp.]MDQ7995593.1 hypothetical protein [Luteibacter sp.]MDQ8047681.1 hypothetical protein [Luteibacter sp.]
MHDTIDLLEAIGSNAALRHASPEELASLLEENDASQGLRDFSVSGDDTALTKELGLTKMHGEHHSQTGAHEGDDDDDDHDHDHHDDEDDDDGDEGDSDDSPDQPNDPDKPR